MAASVEKSEEGTKTGEKDGKKPFVHRTALDVQRHQLNKLMADPDKDIVIPERPKHWSPHAPPEFIRHVMGSSAGAGSGEFHVYRSTRRREYARVNWIEQEAKEKQEQDAYHEKIDKLKADADAKTAKKRAKRQKKKQRKMEAKKRKAAENSTGEGNEPEEKKNDSDQSEDSEEDEPHFVIGGK